MLPGHSVVSVPDRRRAAQRSVLALTVLTCMGLFVPAAPAARLRVGDSAPSAVLTTLDGRRIATQDLLGRVVILTFWATWCSPCREELPLLSAYAAQHASEGLVVLAFSIDDPEQIDAVRRVAQSLSFPVGLMTENSAPGYGRIWRLPVNFTIGRDGRLVDNGWDDKQPVWTQERLERIVSPLLH